MNFYTKIMDPTTHNLILAVKINNPKLNYYLIFFSHPTNVLQLNCIQISETSKV